MTDYSLIQNELKAISGFDDDTLNRYESCIKNAAICVNAMLGDKADENDSRVIYLCAVKAYYTILLLQNQNDGITSFKAGDVSYTCSEAVSISAVKTLLETAMNDCSTLIKKDTFVFKAV